MLEALGYDFMRNALWAALLVSIACGIMGPLVAVNRMVAVAGGVAHAAYGGIGLALVLGISPLAGAAGVALVSAAIMGWLTLRLHQRADTVIGVIWAGGMASGIILVNLSGAYGADIMSYLFGSILTVPGTDLALMVGFDIFAAAVVILFRRELTAVSFDREFAGLRGVPVTALYFLMLELAALTVVFTIRIVGLILVIALLTIPAAIAERHSRSLCTMMGWATLYSILFTFAGLFISYTCNITAGAAIIAVACAAYALMHTIAALMRNNTVSA